MTSAVCDFAQNSEHPVTMVKVHNAGPKVSNWTVIVAFEIHGWFAQLQIFSEKCFSLTVPECCNLLRYQPRNQSERFVMKTPG